MKASQICVPEDTVKDLKLGTYDLNIRIEKVGVDDYKVSKDRVGSVPPPEVRIEREVVKIQPYEAPAFWLLVGVSFLFGRFFKKRKKEIQHGLV